MMHPETQTTVKLSGRDGLLAAVPALLGFHPEESAVLVTMSGPTRRIGPVIRVNLPTADMLDSPDGAATATAQLAQLFIPYAAQYGTEVAVIIYTDRIEEFDAAPLGHALGLIVSVIDAITVRNSPQDVPDELTVAALAHGRTVLADRQQLNQSVQHRPEVAMSPLLAELGTVATRDALISRMLADRDPDAMAALVTAAQGTPDTDPRVPDLCSTLAVIAYRHGDGALAQVAVDRALTGDPDHRLSHLMLAVMAAGLPPQDLDGLLAP